MTTPLTKQLEERLKGSGGLSSADLVAQAVQVTPVERVVGTAVTTLTPADIKDPLVSPEKTEPPQSTLAAKPLQARHTDAEGIDVETTEGERQIFLTACAEGRRFELPFSLFGGRVRGVFRSRTHAETRAINAELSKEIRDKKIMTDSDYVMRLRAVLLTAQVAVFQGAENPPLVAPLNRTLLPTGEQAPGWLDYTQRWEDMDDGMATALQEQLRTFELKYWTLIRHAGDQNFWLPATST